MSDNMKNIYEKWFKIITIRDSYIHPNNLHPIRTQNEKGLNSCCLSPCYYWWSKVKIFRTIKFEMDKNEV